MTRFPKKSAAPIGPTPYATLLVRPSASDDDVRAAYHALVRKERLHPDANGGVAKERWYEVTMAYTSLKTEAARAVWERSMRLLRGVCEECDGFGVKGSRLTRVRRCPGCEGRGRK